MGWITKVKIAEPPHMCFLPSAMEILSNGLAPGSVWECPKCKTRYMYKGTNVGVATWERGRVI